MLSLLFAGRIQRLGVYTVSQMLELRYGPGSSVLSGVVMWGYTLMLSVTSTIAYATIFGALFDIGKVPAIILGGSVVIIYSVLGGMWSITLTDFVQFIIKTIGIFFILLPIALYKTGGFSGLADKLPADATSLTAIGGSTILTYFVIYTFGLLIGQDIWQRVFTARSPGVARWAGAASGVYCLLYAVAGAVIGMAAKVLLPALESRDDAFAAVRRDAVAAGAGRSGARRCAGRGDVHVERRADRHRDRVQPGHRCPASRPRHRGGAASTTTYVATASTSLASGSSW